MHEHVAKENWPTHSRMRTKIRCAQCMSMLWRKTYPHILGWGRKYVVHNAWACGEGLLTHTFSDEDEHTLCTMHEHVVKENLPTHSRMRTKIGCAQCTSMLQRKTYPHILGWGRTYVVHNAWACCEGKLTHTFSDEDENRVCTMHEHVAKVYLPTHSRMRTNKGCAQCMSMLWRKAYPHILGWGRKYVVHNAWACCKGKLTHTFSDEDENRLCTMHEHVVKVYLPTHSRMRTNIGCAQCMSMLWRITYPHILGWGRKYVVHNAWACCEGKLTHTFSDEDENRLRTMHEHAVKENLPTHSRMRTKIGCAQCMSMLWRKTYPHILGC